MNTRMKHRLSLMSAAATVCSLLAAFPASAQKLEITKENYEGLDENCTNIVGAKEIIHTSYLSPDSIVQYSVDTWYNQGFSDAEITLTIPPELELVMNFDEEPATAGDVGSMGASSSSYDADTRSVTFTFYRVKNNLKNGTLFYVDLKLPSDLKNGDVFPMKLEVRKMKNTDGDIQYNVLDGYIKPFIFTGPDPTLTFYKGNVSLSHYISVADAELILKDYVTALSGKPSIFYNDQKSLADVDENGTVDLFDAQYVLIYCTENTAKKNITWAELIGKEPECNSVVVSLDTLNGWHHKQ